MDNIENFNQDESSEHAGNAAIKSTEKADATYSSCYKCLLAAAIIFLLLLIPVANILASFCII